MNVKKSVFLLIFTQVLFSGIVFPIDDSPELNNTTIWKGLWFLWKNNITQSPLFIPVEVDFNNDTNDNELIVQKEILTIVNPETGNKIYIFVNIIKDLDQFVKNNQSCLKHFQVDTSFIGFEYLENEITITVKWEIHSFLNKDETVSATSRALSDIYKTLFRTFRTDTLRIIVLKQLNPLKIITQQDPNNESDLTFNVASYDSSGAKDNDSENEISFPIINQNTGNIPYVETIFQTNDTNRDNLFNVAYFSYKLKDGPGEILLKLCRKTGYKKNRIKFQDYLDASGLNKSVIFEYGAAMYQININQYK